MSRTKILDREEIQGELESLSDWKFVDDSLQRDYIFPTFERAIAFMVECAPTIAREDHHPEWTNVFDKVHVRYRTHDAGNVVTDKDIAMATKMEGIYRRGYLNGVSS